MKALKNLLRSMKKEVCRKNCGFDHTTPQDFIKSQWQKSTKSVPYLLYRWIIAIFFICVVIESLLYPDDGSQFWLYFIYLTNWGIILCMVTNLLSAVLVTIWHFSPESSGNFEILTIALQIYWVLHITTLVLSLVITIIYWSLLYNTVEATLTVTNIITHASNSITMFIDFLIVAHPIRLLHVFLPILVGLFYAGFSAIYQLCGGQNKKGQPFIYHVIDWREPRNAALTVVGVLLLASVVYILLFIIYKLRLIIYRLVNKTTFSLPNTVIVQSTKTSTIDRKPSCLLNPNSATFYVRKSIRKSVTFSTDTSEDSSNMDAIVN